jgi:hypothetical protein
MTVTAGAENVSPLTVGFDPAPSRIAGSTLAQPRVSPARFRQRAGNAIDHSRNVAMPTAI